MYRCSCKSNQVGQIFNIGGSNEVSNVKVAKELIRIMDMADREEALVTFVPDRPFNDLRYTIDCAKLHALGWKELVSFPEGLEHTVKVRFSVLLIVGVSISLPQSFIFLSLSIVADYSMPPFFVHLQWYKEHSSRFGNVENALVAHPRAGLATSTSSNALAGGGSS